MPVLSPYMCTPYTTSVLPSMCKIHQFLSCSLSFHSSTLFELSLAIGYSNQVTIVSIAVTEVSTSGLDPDHSGLSTSVAPQPRIEVWATLVRAAEVSSRPTVF